MEASFKTPVYIIKPKFSESLLNELEADIYKIQSNSPSIEVSNINGWHSETDLFRREETSIKTLCGVLMTETTRQLMSISSNFDPKTLRHNVTSPGGTTEAGLEILASKKTGLFDLLNSTINSAKKRAIYLNSNN